ncbi:hypothetical protein [Streptomyces atratus]|uniref:hypothetical protein n=1 Tax=Streptomyces atratus TaxID=1893 RepID=UPI0036624B9E
MKYTISTTERVNVGNYEFIELSAGIEFSEDEVPEGIGSAKFARDKIDALLLSHRRRALAMVPEDASSFITDHPALES